MNTSETETAARQRYKKRGVFPEPKNQRQITQNEISHRLVPSLSYFIFAFFSGLCAGAALMLNAKPLWILAAALLTFCGPFFGIALSCVSGSFTYLLRSLGKYLLEQLLFIAGSAIPILTWKSSCVPAQDVLDFFSQINLYAMLTVLLCALITAVLLRNNSRSPLGLGNGVMFFILFPLSVMLWSWVSGTHETVISALRTVLLYSLLATAAAVLGLIFSRAGSFRFGSLVMSLPVLLFALLYGLNAADILHPSLQSRFGNSSVVFLHSANILTYTPTMTATQTSTPTNTPTATYTSTPTETPTLPPTSTATPTMTPTIPDTATPTVTPSITPTRTLRPTLTPTATRYVTATPVYAIVAAKSDVGVLVRQEPATSSGVLRSVWNDNVLEMTGEVTEADGVSWVQVVTNEGNYGWVDCSVLKTATPVP